MARKLHKQQRGKMNLSNKISVTLEKCDKCSLLLDADCPLGQLFDFACAVQAFTVQKINESEARKAQQERPQIEPSTLAEEDHAVGKTPTPAE
jgi:hypothetical protein